MFALMNLRRIHRALLSMDIIEVASGITQAQVLPDITAARNASRLLSEKLRLLASELSVEQLREKSRDIATSFVGRHGPLPGYGTIMRNLSRIAREKDLSLAMELAGNSLAATRNSQMRERIVRFQWSLAVKAALRGDFELAEHLGVLARANLSPTSSFFSRWTVKLARFTRLRGTQTETRKQLHDLTEIKDERLKTGDQTHAMVTAMLEAKSAPIW